MSLTLRWVFAALATVMVIGSQDHVSAQVRANVRAGNANVFTNASVFMMAVGSTFELSNFAQTIGDLSGDGSVNLGSATLTFGTATASRRIAPAARR